jgi:hypothetical protein
VGSGGGRKRTTRGFDFTSCSRDASWWRDFAGEDAAAVCFVEADVQEVQQPGGVLLSCEQASGGGAGYPVGDARHDRASGGDVGARARAR